MIKRLFILLLALALTAVMPALAAEPPTPGDALYLITERTGSTDVVLGTAVLFRQQDQLLTSDLVCGEGKNLSAIGMDGRHSVASITRLAETGVALLTLSTPSDRTPLELAPASALPRSLLLGSTPDATPMASPVYNSALTVFRDQPALQVFTQDLMLPGAVLVDDQGRLAGLSMMNLAEGQYASAALLTGALEEALAAKGMTRTMDKGNWIAPTLTMAKGSLMADWTGQTREEGVYVMYVMGATNGYYTSYVYGAEASTGEVLLPPGHDYAVVMQWAPDRDSHSTQGMFDHAQLVRVPAETFTDYAFTDRSWLCSAPLGSEEPAQPESTRITTLTTAEMGAPTMAYFLQIINTYQVTESVTLPMTVSVTAPDKSFCYDVYNYVFDPALQAEDAFAIDVTGLLKDCVALSGGSAPVGEYTVSYSIGGQVAGTYAFTVTAPAE